MRSTRTRLVRAIMAAAVMTAGVAGFAPGTASAQAAPPQDRARGLVFDGLARGRAGDRCAGLFEIRGRASEVLGCTPGPDPSPANVDVRAPVETARLKDTAAALPMPTAIPGTNGSGIACVGDGTTGYRVEAIYATAGGTDRYAQIAPLIQTSYAPFVEWQYRTSAAETGGEVHVPFVTAADAGGCSVVVRREVLSATADDSFGNTISELKARGYNRADRRYMVWMDSNVLCGIGQIYRDSQPGQTNANNGSYTAFSRVDAGCWGYGEAHEIMHNLGGVQPNAPNATPNFHCRDENDEMCYDDDGSGPVVMRSVCSTRDSRLFDCNNDDYFLAGTPAAGSWLSANWNTYNSRFLLRGPLSPTQPTNLAPVVDAGPNRSVALGTSAALDGTVSDDGRPGAAVSVSWAKSAGPGTVAFAAPGSVDTTAGFSVAGTYTLSLTASDTQLTASDTMTVTVTSSSAPVTDTMSGSFTSLRRSVTHNFASGAGAMTVTVNGSSNKTATLYTPSGALLGQVSGAGTRTFTATGPVSGTYRLVVTGKTGSYTATVQHLP